MARFVDLEVEDEEGIAMLQGAVVTAGEKRMSPPQTQQEPLRAATHTTTTTTTTTTNPTVMARAFSCYPVVISIVSSIDLTTLDSLARTARIIHDSLIQFRTVLIASTLRCHNESVPLDKDETLRYRAARVATNGWANMDAGRASLQPGKAGACARDMVGECRRCTQVICRNCAIKPPAPAALRERHRRLCKTCARAPLTTMACPALDHDLSLASDAVQDTLCNCDSGGVWLCQPCGRIIRNADGEYQRIWRWRNHYGESLGCLGTGIGDGDRGVICGREKDCLAAREREQETDCDAEDARGSASASPWTSSEHLLAKTPPPRPTSSGYFSLSSPAHNTSRLHAATGSNSIAHASALPTPPASASASTTTPSSSLAPHPHSIEALLENLRHQNDARTPSPLLGPGYERHEIEGIGGIVKRKLVRMVRVGACVPEWQDEKSASTSPAAKVLGHEVRGDVRSWCGWCWRVIPGDKDAVEVARQKRLLDEMCQHREREQDRDQVQAQVQMSTSKSDREALQLERFPPTSTTRPAGMVCVPVRS